MSARLWQIVHWCPNCGRHFDSPAVCSDGTHTVRKIVRKPRKATGDV